MIADYRKRFSALRGFAVAKKLSRSSKPSVRPTAFFVRPFGRRPIRADGCANGAV